MILTPEQASLTASIEDLLISQQSFVSQQGPNIEDQWSYIQCIMSPAAITAAEERRYTLMFLCPQLLIPTQIKLPSHQGLFRVLRRGAQTVSVALHSRRCGIFPHIHGGEANSVKGTWSGNSSLLSPPCIPPAASEVQRGVCFSLERFGFVAFHRSASIGN